MSQLDYILDLLKPCWIGLQLDLAREKVYALVDTGAVKTLMTEKTLSMRVEWCPWETVIKINNAVTFPVLLTGDFTHKILLESDIYYKKK